MYNVVGVTGNKCLVSQKVVLLVEMTVTPMKSIRNWKVSENSVSMAAGLAPKFYTLVEWLRKSNLKLATIL